MSDYSADLIRNSGYSRAGFAEHYDSARPAPPEALLDVLMTEAQVDRPGLVVDLGCGTGLSTRVWAERAESVIGVEPNPEMKALAERRTTGAKVSYVEAFSSDTGLEDASADIVTCSQSLHWMEPEPTFAEVARILWPGGVFAAYDYDWPPIVHWQVEAAFADFVAQARRLREERGSSRRSWRKDEHLERMRASGCFRFVREVVLHGREQGDAERIVGMALSLGPATTLLDDGVSEEELGLTALREVAGRVLGDRMVPLWLGYRVRLGVK